MRLKLFFTLLVILSFSALAGGQSDENEKLPTSAPPENVMQEVVRRILIYKFKPASKNKVVYLVAENVNLAWLPVISNVEFRLLTSAELQDTERDVYFFSKPEYSKGVYEINFSFGDPGCNYSGENWKFRHAKNKVRLWMAGGMGGGCGGGGGGDFDPPGKLNTYPNELKGYKFFDSGKLKGLKLSVSTREDVEKIFGSSCESGCDYNADWKIDFSYFSELGMERNVDNKKTKYVPKEEIIGKLQSIRLIPKRRISFSRIVFSHLFGKSYGGSIGDDFDSKGNFKSAAGTFYDTHSDRYGLNYNVYTGGYTVGDVEKDDRTKGNLLSIEYSIPASIEETMFVEKQ